MAEGAERPLHRTLARQLRRVGLDQDAPPPTAEAWREHLARVSAAYEQADDERYLSERSLRISSDELLHLNESLRRGSELRAAERDRLQALVGALGDGVCAFDEGGRIEVANPEAERLFGIPATGLVGKPLAELVQIHGIAEDDRGRPADPVASVIAQIGTTIEEEVRFTVSSGREFVALYVLNGFDGAEGRGAVMAFRDVTDRWQSDRVNQALHKVGRAVAAGDHVYELVARETADIFWAEAMVCRFDAEGATVVGAAGDHSSEGDLLPYGGGGALDAVRATGRPARIDDYSTLPADSPLRAHATERGYTATTAAPVEVDGSTWGAILVTTRRPDGIPAAVESRLNHFAELLGFAIGNRQARAELEALANTDPLTGFGNHRAFHERLKHEIAGARRRGVALSLAVLDIDRFKSINDDHGHQVGDEVLRGVAEILVGAARESDVLCRVGGDELAWLLPDCAAPEAWQAVDRGRERVAAEYFPGVGRVTLSAGVCDTISGPHADDLLRFADGALYWAKHHGRDCVIRYTPEVVEVLSDTERAEHLARQQALQSIRVLARAVDAKDTSTREHSERVADVAVQIAHVLGWELTAIAELREAGLVHDVGKISVPDAILFKAEALTPPELERVRAHAAIGAEMVADVLTEEQVAWIRGHHERWDGTGYPDGLAADTIPMGALILALADSWDVMTTYRPYSPPMGVREALAECRRCSGTQFWPGAVEALERLCAAGALMGWDALTVT